MMSCAFILLYKYYFRPHKTTFMIKKLLTVKSLFTLLLFITFHNVFSQIDYYEDFESENNSWSSDVYQRSKTLPCSGTRSYAGETFSINSIAVPVSSTTKSLGACNNQPITFSYDYKLLDFFNSPVSGAIDWGWLIFEYATDINGEWTVIDRVTTENHTESANCAFRTVTFTPTTGANLYIRVTLEANIEIPEQDFYVYFDNVQLVQAPGLPCADKPEASTAITSANNLCNSQNAVVSLSPYYASSGLSYQWQQSVDGTIFTNIAVDGNNDRITTAQKETTWYRAIVTCNATGEQTISDPVKVISSGYVCVCDIIFRSTIEPISLVKFAGINNRTSAVVNGAPSLEDFRGLTPGNVVKGKTYPITLKGNTNNPGGTFKNCFTVLMDWNQNGDFTDAGEKYEVGCIVNSNGEDDVELVADIAVPLSALTGKATMRIIKNYARFARVTCGPGFQFGYGQAEDYLVSVQDGCNMPDIKGESTQTITVQNGKDALISDIFIEVIDGAEVNWFATELDAINGENPLTMTSIIANGKTYYAIQKLNDCQSKVFAVTVNVVLSAADFNLGKFSYYPNPVTDLFTITSENIIDTIKVYNLLGQEVASQKAFDKTVGIDLKVLPTGTYLVKIESGKYSSTIKIIKR